MSRKSRESEASRRVGLSHSYPQEVAYKPRVEVPNGCYHVGARGNNKQTIFLNEDDRWVFLLILQRVAAKYGWSIHAYCLMGNHYHLVLQIGDKGISNGMGELNTAYATTFNANHGRVNHLFGRRFWDELIVSDRQLLETCRYVLLNPCRAGISRAPAEWIWSSYRATIGMALATRRLATGVASLLALIDPDPKTAAHRFGEYCAERPGGQAQRQPP